MSDQESGRETEWVAPADLKARPPFSNLFGLANRGLTEKIAHSMREGGFDPSKPVNVWRGKNLVIDGHHRRQAAIEAHVQVLVCFHDFPDEDAALDYAIANQRDRRNLSDSELASLVKAVDKRRKRGGDHKSEEAKSICSAEQIETPSHVQTAALAGTSPAKVRRVRTIFDHAEETGDTEERDAVLRGAQSINAAERSVAAKKRKEITARREKVRIYFDKNPGASFPVAMAALGLSRGTLQADKMALGLARPRGPSIDTIKSRAEARPYSPHHAAAWKKLMDDHIDVMRAIHRAGGMRHIAGEWQHDRIIKAIAFLEEVIGDLEKMRADLASLCGDRETIQGTFTTGDFHGHAC
jgi:hypothetical protein